jgi:MYXO-CTERM domain-containing protein
MQVAPIQCHQQQNTTRAASTRGGIKRSVKAIAAIVAGSTIIATTPAGADVITFDFDSMAYRSSDSPGSNSAVQTYLRTTWTAGGGSGNVDVSGAGELSNNQYTGDNHVVGPATCTRYVSGHCTRWSVTSATLGSTEGGVQGGATLESFSSSHPDNYIVNSGSDRITITFPTPVYFVSFDFEIFPDGTCPSSTDCGSHQANLPDFTFLTGNSAASLLPGFPTMYGTFPGSTGTYPHSPNSGGTSTEHAPQYLDVSGDLYFNEGITMVSFVDWPQRIGIDNLVVDTDCRQCVSHQDAPEPPTLPILALGLGLLALTSRRRHSGSMR